MHAYTRILDDCIKDKNILILYTSQWDVIYDMGIDNALVLFLVKEHELVYRR